MPENKSNVTRADYEFLCDTQEKIGEVVEDEEKAIEAGHAVAQLIQDRGLWPTEERNSPASGEAQSYPALQWREQKPEEEGWYWMRPGYNVDVPGHGKRMVKVFSQAGIFGLRVDDPNYDAGVNRSIEEYQDAEWAGPIPVPRESEGESAG